MRRGKQSVKILGYGIINGAARDAQKVYEGNSRLVSEWIERSGDGAPRKAVWLKQNCGVSCGRSDGCDIATGGVAGLDGSGGACCQKRCASSDDSLMIHKVYGGRSRTSITLGEYSTRLTVKICGSEQSDFTKSASWFCAGR